MSPPKERDEILWEAIESGRLDDSLAIDADVNSDFEAYRRLESLFAVLRGASAPAEALPLLSQMGRYEIREVLGRGAFGTVYLAIDPQLDRPIAIKVPHAQSFRSEQDAKRFLDEAKLAARLKHPGIVTIHDAGQDQGLCYIVMEYVKGDTLLEASRRERQSLDWIVAVLAEVADALSYAHANGFIHRDLKPANILVDPYGHPHITDFGLAISEEVQDSRAGQVAGTPAYMSPEQVRGETQWLDGRTDIWSLGVILYELLTSRQPFLGRDLASCLDEIQNRNPKPPRQIDKNIPAKLEAVCLRCLSKDVTGRFPTATDLAYALRSAVAPAVPKRDPRPWYVAALVLVLVIAAVGVGLAISQRLAKNRKTVERVTGPPAPVTPIVPSTQVPTPDVTAVVPKPSPASPAAFHTQPREQENPPDPSKPKATGAAPKRPIPSSALPPARPVVEDSPFVPDKELIEQIASAPVLITDFDPKQGAPGHLITLQGRGFRDTRCVFFTISGQQTIDRCAKFQVVSGNELRVEVPLSVDDRARARIIVVTLQGVTVTLPPKPLVIDKPRDGRGWKDVREWEDESSGYDFLLIRSGGIVAHRPDNMTAFLADGSTLECAGGDLCHFVQRGGTLLDMLSGTVVYRESGSRVGNRDGARVIEVPSVSLSSIPALFEFLLPPMAVGSPSDGPPIVRDLWPREGIEGQVVTLNGRGFANTNAVLTATHGRSKPASFRVVSDGELHVQIPSLYSVGVVYFVVVTPRGATATVPTAEEQAQPTEWRPVMVKMEKGFFVGEDPNGRLQAREASVTFVDQDGVVSSSTRGVVLIKRGATLGKLDTSHETSVVFESGAIILDPKRKSYIETPMIEPSPVPRMYKNKGSRYHHLAEQTWPVVDWINAVAFRNYEDLPPLFSARLRETHAKNSWGKISVHQRATLEQKLEVATLRDVDWADDVDFFYAGNDSSGEVIVSRRGGPRLEVRVICEEGEWKIDNAFYDATKPLTTP